MALSTVFASPSCQFVMLQGCKLPFTCYRMLHVTLLRSKSHVGAPSSTFSCAASRILVAFAVPGANRKENLEVPRMAQLLPAAEMKWDVQAL